MDTECFRFFRVNKTGMGNWYKGLNRIQQKNLQLAGMGGLAGATGVGGLAAGSLLSGGGGGNTTVVRV